MKTAALWDMTPCSLVKCTNVSDDPVASIIRVESSEMLAHSYQTTWPHIPNVGTLLPDNMTSHPKCL